MVASAGTGGSIRVTPEALHGLAEALREHASRAQSLLGDVSGKTRVSLGQAGLQESLEAFNRTWGRAALGAASAGGGMASAVDAAAVSYQRTEDDLAALLQPGDSPTGIDTPVPASSDGYVNELGGRPGGDLGQLLEPGGGSGGVEAAPDSAGDYIGGLAAGSEGADHGSGQAAPGRPAVPEADD